MNIIARKPTNKAWHCEGAEYIVVVRDHPYHPYVSATATPWLLANNEWTMGHYFETRDAALAHFNNR